MASSFGELPLERRELARVEFVSGMFPTLVRLAEHLGCTASSMQAAAKRDGWAAQRQAYQAELSGVQQANVRSNLGIALGAVTAGFATLARAFEERAVAAVESGDAAEFAAALALGDDLVKKMTPVLALGKATSGGGEQAAPVALLSAPEAQPASVVRSSRDLVSIVATTIMESWSATQQSGQTVQGGAAPIVEARAVGTE